MSILVASFDPGSKNFAFIVEKVNTLKINKQNILTCSTTILTKNKDLTFGCKKATKKCKNPFDPQLFVNITTYLEEFTPLFDMCNVFLIERQMSFGKRINLKALRISQHIASWLINRYGAFKEILDFGAFYKTQVLNAPKKISKFQRKKWSSTKAMEIWKKRGDNERINEMLKKLKSDDVSDCLLMCVSFYELRYILKKL